VCEWIHFDDLCKICVWGIYVCLCFVYI